MEECGRTFLTNIMLNSNLLEKKLIKSGFEPREPSKNESIIYRVNKDIYKGFSVGLFWDEQETTPLILNQGNRLSFKSELFTLRANGIPVDRSPKEFFTNFNNGSRNINVSKDLVWGTPGVLYLQKGDKVFYLANGDRLNFYSENYNSELEKREIPSSRISYSRNFW